MTTTVTKKDLAYRIAERMKLKKVDVKNVLQMFIDEIILELAGGNRMEFREFGVFEVKTRAARRARNPRTGARVDVPAKTVIHFKAGRLMKQKVSEIQAAARAPEKGDPQSQAATQPRPLPVVTDRDASSEASAGA